MAKTLKGILEVYSPKSKDEKRFKDKHIIAKQKLDDAGTQDDKMFNATNIKTISREKTRHGYDVNKDERVYEESTKLHPMALHVSHVDSGMHKGKYKVHAVGKSLADSIDVGEHLSDTELDDASEMGAKIKHKDAYSSVKEESIDEKRLTPAAMKEDAEELDELKKSTVGSYIRKKFGKMSGEPASKNPNEIFAKKDAKGIQRAGLRMSGIKATQKESIDFFDDADEVTVLKSLDIEIQESYTFGDYLTAAKDIVGEEAAIDLANYAFNKQDTALFVEQVTRSDIQSKINTHVAAGHKVSEPKYITKDGKLHAEYVVTDKESGIRRKYIQHGTMRKVENMGAKGKKDSE